MTRRQRFASGFWSDDDDAYLRTARLFCWPNGQAFTTTDVRVAVRKCMLAAGLDQTRFGAHSLRIGGATAALAAGVSPQVIRMLGRWSSDVYLIYCRMSLQAALGVSEALCSAVVTPLAPAFHEEHLELLPSEVNDISQFFGAEEATAPTGETGRRD